MRINEDFFDDYEDIDDGIEIPKSIDEYDWKIVIDVSNYINYIDENIYKRVTEDINKKIVNDIDGFECTELIYLVNKKEYIFGFSIRDYDIVIGAVKKFLGEIIQEILVSIKNNYFYLEDDEIVLKIMKMNFGGTYKELLVDLYLNECCNYNYNKEETLCHRYDLINGTPTACRIKMVRYILNKFHGN